MLMTKSLIALGSNINASPSLFHQVLAALEANGVKIDRVSSFHDTTPIGAAAQGMRFLNAAAIVSFGGSAAQLLSLLQSTENQFGRERVIRWGSRTIDLDLLMHGTEVITEPKLLVPHPALWYRHFVLSSAVEVAADWLHPLLNESLGSLWNRLQSRPILLRVDASGVAADLPFTADQLLDVLGDPADGVLVTGTCEMADAVAFATLQFCRATSEEPALSHRHPASGSRSICLFVDDAADAVAQVKMVAGTILG
jgi:2-amino-4-hydroxy-6-hydroxymethyldihydropteridine diphosphokinase